MLTLEEYFLYRRPSASAPAPPLGAWPPPPLEPLGPYPPPGPSQYQTTLPFVPPAGPDRRFVRMNAWGVVVPGLPFVKGVASEHPDRLMTYVIQRYDAEWRAKCYAEHHRRGYTHWFLSLADMAIEDGMSPEAVLALAQEIRAQGFWISMWLGSKNYPAFIPQDADAATWRAKIEPYIAPMLEADCLHHAVIGGEFDMWNQGDPNNDMPFQIASTVLELCQPAGCDVYFHFATHVTFWGNVPGSWQGRAIPDRFAWTREMCNLGVRGIYYQGDPAWAPNEYQGRIADSLGRVDARWDFVAHEIMAIWEFMGHPAGAEYPNELDAAMMGYLCLCTGPSGQVPGVQMWGFGDGARYLDGRVL